MKRILMKKRYLLALGAALMLLASCSSRPRYGCNRYGCAIEAQ
ncbi:MAG: hypothetical protein V4581_01345 [Bacteroidota bacterium]